MTTTDTRRPRRRAIGEGFFAAFLVTFYMVLLVPDRLTRTGEVVAGALFWVEFAAVAGLVATSDRRDVSQQSDSSRVRGIGTLVALVLPLVAWLILYPFALGFSWVTPPAFLVACIAAGWARARGLV